jgi:undecaprenyl diphosphate synthase
MAQSDPKKLKLLPNHIAIVPDGNGRWAERRGLPRLEGHRVGADNTYRLIRYLNDYPIKYITMYGFSTENWTRPKEEVEGLFKVMEDLIARTALDVHAHSVKLRHIGRMQELPKGLQDALQYAMDLTKDNTGMTLTVAFNYGGRAELLDAMRRMIQDGVKAQDVTEDAFEKRLDTAGLPDVDLFIRTGDELRLSNFLIWQTTYSEYHFTKVLWPDFSKKDMDRALISYSRRVRRFGGL